MTDTPDDIEHYSESIEQIGLESEIHFYMSYLTNLEEFFTMQRGEINYKFDEFMTKESDDEMRSKAEQAQEYELRAINEFENLLRKSFVVNIYSFLENRMVSECRARTIEGKPPKFSGRDVIGQIKTYFKETLHANFPSHTSEWNEIKKIQKLRNCIIHSQGRLNKDEDDNLKEYIARNRNLNLIHNEVYIRKGYCDATYHTIKTFLELLMFDDK